MVRAVCRQAGHVKIDVWLTSLHGDPRRKVLLRKMNLPERRSCGGSERAIQGAANVSFQDN